MIEQRGDVFGADFTEFEWFDFLIGGSPCIFWSISQKINRETEASGMGWELFSQYVRALHEAKPKFFIYENNKSMSKAIRASIDEAFGFEAVCINSALVSAQNRQRLYWVGKRNDDGTYSKVNVEQPEDRGILLRDILETGVHLSENDKSFALTTRCCGDIPEDTLTKHRHSMVAVPVRIPEYGQPDKSRPVTACYAYKGSGEGSLVTEAFPENPNKQVRDYVAEPVMRGRETTKQVYEVRNGLITIKGKQYPIKLVDGFYIIRKLTVRECMRLQTVPEWYEFPVSDTQALKMLGNGWSVDVIAWLLNAIVKEVQDERQAG
jgi:DNA (cytosine-5)-methyltransferase 3A